MFHSVLRTGSGLKDTIEGQMANPYFPVNMGVMAAQRHFSNLDGKPVSLQGATLRSAPLNHPQGCVGYRIEADGGAFVLATDNEPGSPVHDQALRDLAQDADVMVYDAQYTPEQLAGEKKGWGHSSWLEGVRIAQECNVKKLILFHHDPDSDDDHVDGLVMKARQEFPNTWGANEGLVISLPRGSIAHAMLIRRQRAPGRPPVQCGVAVDASRGVIRTASGMRPTGLPRIFPGPESISLFPGRSTPASRCNWNWCSPTKSPIRGNCASSLWPGRCVRGKPAMPCPRRSRTLAWRRPSTSATRIRRFLFLRTKLPVRKPSAIPVLSCPAPPTARGWE